MSIINQVLNDIERRDTSTSSLDPKKFIALELEQPKSKTKLVGIVFIIAMLISVAGFFWDQSNDTLAENTLPENAVTKNTALALPISETTQVVVADEGPQKAAVSQKKTVLVADESKLLTMPKTTTKVVIAKTPVIKNSPAIKRAPHPVKPESKEQLIIKPVKLTLVQLAQLKFNQAMDQQRQGFYGAAQDLWRANLLTQADHHQSREHLVLSFVAEVKTDIALDILNKAISQFPKHQPYQILAANIYLQTNNARQALDVLRQPYLVDSSDNTHLALAGSLAQQLQQWHQAELNYQVLVTRNGQNEKWLIGLAIALDGQGKSDLALSRYIQFAQLANTSDILKNYAMERILRLQAQQLSVQQQRDNNGKT